MPHVSRYKLPKNVEAELISKLNLALTHIGKDSEMIEFLDALLTPTEKLMLAKRLAIIVLLEEGVPESKIADILHVTRITVAKMQLFYEARGAGFKIALKKLEEQNMLDEFKKVLISLARYSIKAAGGYVESPIKSPY